jgi:hypothetical protein
LIAVGLQSSSSSSILSAPSTPLDQLQQHQQNVVVSSPPRRRKQPDGIFNGVPVYFQDVTNQTTKPYSVLNCAGENYQKENWKHRSCHFRFLCLNMDTKEYSVYQRPEDVQIQKWSVQRPLMDLSSSYIQANSTVSIGGINRKWGDDGVLRMEWFPKILQEQPATFYTLPDSVVMIPFHSLAGWNPGHLVWDDFLSISTLLQMFQLVDDKDPLLLRCVLPDGEGLWVSCDAPTKQADCRDMQQKCWPLMRRHNTSLLTRQMDAKLDLLLDTKRKSNLVCAKDGVAGIGALTDHGTKKLHGWHKEDYQITHNHGRGGAPFEVSNLLSC